MFSLKLNYKTQFELLEDFRAHIDQLENQLKEFGKECSINVQPKVEKSLVKIREFCDTIHAIDKAIAKERDGGV